MRPRSQRLAKRKAGLALTSAMLLVAFTVTSSEGGALAAAALPVPNVSISLDTSLAEPAASWVALPMGDLGQPANRFWQLFVMPDGASRWSLVTPPGVADNGGLVSAYDAGSVLTGFEPSQQLRFSPLATTTNDGQSWVPGLLGDGLAAVPDAVAETGSQVLALTAGRPGAVLASEGGLSSWRTLVTEQTLADNAADRRCGLTGLTAVAFTTTGEAVIAGACAHPGVIGIFVQDSGQWQTAALDPPAALSGATTQVLRLTATGGSLSAVVAARSRSHRFLLGARLAPGASAWTWSDMLAVGGSTTVTSSGSSPGGGIFVALADGSDRRVESWTGIGPAWTALPQTPSGTATVAFTPAGAMDALLVHSSTLTVLTWSALAGRWVRSQVIHVPIQYGSSG